MITVTLWLLMYTTHETHVVERFATQQECEAVRAEAVKKIDTFYQSRSACIKATVARGER